MPPSWMMIEITSFGSLSMLFQNLQLPHDKRAIAHSFGVDDSTFASWLHSIVYVRNVCAHHSRLWNRVMRISPKVPMNPGHRWISVTTIPNQVAGGSPINLNNRMYFFLSMIVYLLNIINPKNTFKQRLFKLLQKYPLVNVPSSALGHPKFR